jgi:hypothetical protein
LTATRKKLIEAFGGSCEFRIGRLLVGAAACGHRTGPRRFWYNVMQGLPDA